MMGLALIFAETALIAFILHRLLKANERRRTRSTSSGDRLDLAQAMPEWVKRFGVNSNSFLTLYPGFEYFSSRERPVDGAIAYVQTSGCWVGASEPVTSQENQIELLKEWALETRRCGRRPLLLPVDQDFARKAKEAGFGILMIGSEPVFRLAEYPPNGVDWMDLAPAAKPLKAKGARVAEFNFEGLEEDEKSELEEMVEAWFGTRKSAALGFLNQVLPWHLHKEKRYFKVTLQEKVIGFQVAIPIAATNSWYLLDTIRRPDSPVGTTELLNLEAMRLLKAEGVNLVSMGVAPLSGMELAASPKIAPVAGYSNRRLTYEIMDWIFHNGNVFYNFEPLFRYKMKFKPSFQKPTYLVYGDGVRKARLGIRDLTGLSQAWLPSGVAHAAGVGVMRLLSKLSVSELIKSMLRPGVIVRSVPPNLGRLAYRCRFTLLIFALNVVGYALTTDFDGTIDPVMSERWAFSWPMLLKQPLHAIMLSPFLSWGAPHMAINILTLLLFTGSLEYLAGFRFTAISYLVPMLVCNPLTVGLAALSMRFLPFAIDTSVADVGASLGIFGTAGALHWFLRGGRYWLSVLVGMELIVFAESPAEHWIFLDHCLAIFTGLAIGKILLRD